MLSELTDLKLQAAAMELELRRRKGELGEQDQVSLAEYARLAGVSEGTVHRVFRMGLAKAAARLIADPDLPPHLARLIARQLSNPKHP